MKNPSATTSNCLTDREMMAEIFFKQTILLFPHLLFPQPRAQCPQEPSLAHSICLLANLSLQSQHPATPVADSPEALLLLLIPCPNSTKQPPSKLAWLSGKCKRALPKILRHHFSDNQALTPYGGGIFRFSFMNMKSPNSTIHKGSFCIIQGLFPFLP